ncbi:hypothetical protein J4219_04040 [Candidatus Woesearchaeota archaeon]|nr:hypothetical protein [Candidatus Woesearchaeota archaeon]
MNKYLFAAAAMAGASVLSFGLSSAYYSGQMEKESYRARTELERVMQESQSRRSIADVRSVSVSLVCVIADTDKDGTPELHFFTPDGKRVFSDDVSLEPFKRLPYSGESF